MIPGFVVNDWLNVLLPMCKRGGMLYWQYIGILVFVILLSFGPLSRNETIMSSPWLVKYKIDQLKSLWWNSFKQVNVSGNAYRVGHMESVDFTNEAGQSGRVLTFETNWHVDTTYVKLEYKVYPNPVKDIMLISFSKSPRSKVKVKVFDVTGSEVLNRSYEPADRLEVAVGSLVNGIYILQITSEDARGTRKLIKI